MQKEALKKLWKRFYKTDIFAHIIGTLLMFYLRTVYLTCRKTYSGRENLQKIWHDKSGIVVCFWHSRLLMSPFAQRSRKDRQAYVLTTRHRDGRYTAAMMRGLQAQPIYGSSSRRAEASLREAVHRLKERAVIVVTPDGPRGPACHAAPGCAQMSRLADAWILPMAYGATRKRILNSWDRLLWPYPFGRLHFHFAEPFKASACGDDIETCREHLQAQLNAAVRTADEACRPENPRKSAP